MRGNAFTVALLGADGAGKTTVAHRLERAFPQSFKYIYMGVNVDSSNHLLPSTRLLRFFRQVRGVKSVAGGPPDRYRIKARPTGRARRVATSVRASLRLVNRLAEEWFRQALAYYYQRRGYIVLFDRHFFSDYYAHDIAGVGAQSFDRRIHGWMLRHIYPKPDLVIVLDAPAEVLFARKHEGTLDLVERRRQEYLQLRDQVKHFSIVDARQSEEAVVCQVNELISVFVEFKNGKRASFLSTTSQVAPDR